MIAVAGDEIFVDPSSIVGSIGVVSASFGFQDMIKKIGVERRVHTSRQEQGHARSLPAGKESRCGQAEGDPVADPRRLHRHGQATPRYKLADKPDLFTGAFWAGIKAKELGLVDDIGDMRSVLKTRYGPKTRMRLISPPRGLFGRRLGVFGASAPNLPLRRGRIGRGRRRASVVGPVRIVNGWQAFAGRERLTNAATTVFSRHRRCRLDWLQGVLLREAERVHRRVRRAEEEARTRAQGTLVQDPDTGEYRLRRD